MWWPADLHEGEHQAGPFLGRHSLVEQHLEQGHGVGVGSDPLDAVAVMGVQCPMLHVRELGIGEPAEAPAPNLSPEPLDGLARHGHSPNSEAKLIPYRDIESETENAQHYHAFRARFSALGLPSRNWPFSTHPYWGGSPPADAARLGAIGLRPRLPRHAGYSGPGPPAARGHRPRSSAIRARPPAHHPALPFD